MDKIEAFIQKHRLKRIADMAKQFSISTAERHGQWNSWGWSGITIQHPDILKEYLDLTGIVGATILDITVPHDNLYLIDGISSWDLYPTTDTSSEMIAFQKADSRSWLEQKSFLPLQMKLCGDPIILITDRGTFEIDYSDSSTVFISKDGIPPKYYTPVMSPVYDVKKVFAPFRNDTIINYQIIPEDPLYAVIDFTNSYSVGISENQTAYIQKLILQLQSGRQIALYNDGDDGMIDLLDAAGSILHIPATSLLDYLHFPAIADESAGT